MPSHRLLAAAALAISLAAAGTASAAPTPELAGTTVIEGSSSTVMRVVVPRDTLVDGQNFFTASRNGRVQGLLLRPAGAPVTDVRSLFGVQTNFCFERACTPAPDAPVKQTITNPTFQPAGEGEMLRIPRGLYDLYLIADGAPGTVTLKLAGLSGSTTVRPTRPAKATILTADPELPQVGTGPIAFSGGVDTPIGEPGGAIFTATLVRGDGPGGFAYGSCIRHDGRSATGTYQACGDPNAASGPSFFVMPEPGAFKSIAGVAALVYPRPTWSLGGWVDGVAANWEVGTIGVGLTFEKPWEQANEDADPVPSPPSAPQTTRTSTNAVLTSSGMPGGTSTSTANGSSGADSTPCRPTLSAKRYRQVLRVTVSSTEACVVEARLVRGRRTIARAAGVARPGKVARLRLRAGRRGALKLVIDTSDAAGNRARRSLKVR